MTTISPNAPRRSAAADFSTVDAAVARRYSARAYRADPVSPELIAKILTLAARAPSGTNIQPWRVHVLTGTSRQGLVDKTCAAFDAVVSNPGAPNPNVPEYDYYPKEFFGVYLDRRRKVGFDLYALLGIAKGDKVAMAAQTKRNFTFFDAPVGLIFTIDRRMGKGSWLDYGMFLQNVMIVAKAHGLDTCPQAAWVDFPRIVAEHLNFPPEEQLVCGMAMGYADTEAAANTLVTERASLDQFVVMHE